MHVGFKEPPLFQYSLLVLLYSPVFGYETFRGNVRDKTRHGQRAAAAWGMLASRKKVKNCQWYNMANPEVVPQFHRMIYAAYSCFDEVAAGYSELKLDFM
jgi:hypothetical protein